MAKFIWVHWLHVECETAVPPVCSCKWVTILYYALHGILGSLTNSEIITFDLEQILNIQCNIENPIIFLW